MKETTDSKVRRLEADICFCLDVVSPLALLYAKNFPDGAEVKQIKEALILMSSCLQVISDIRKQLPPFIIKTDPNEYISSLISGLEHLHENISHLEQCVPQKDEEVSKFLELDKKIQGIIQELGDLLELGET